MEILQTGQRVSQSNSPPVGPGSPPARRFHRGEQRGMGTNNPSEEQLALVEQRIIALADTVVDPGLPMESDSYFDEHGFDLESCGTARHKDKGMVQECRRP